MNDDNDLAAAIETGDVATALRLLAVRPELVNAPHWTPPPLHCAVLWNQPRMAELLLDHGADIEMRDPDRDTTPLRYAIVFCRKEMAALLLSRGANAGPIKEQGTTAMQLAVEAARGGFEEYDDLPARENYQEVVDLLRELGLDDAS